MTIHRSCSSRTAAIVHAFNCGSSCLLALALTATTAAAQPLLTARSSELLATDVVELARLVDEARPAPLPGDLRTQVLSGLPTRGELHDLDDGLRRKLGGLAPVLQVTKRESIYTIKIIDLPQAAVAIHARTVVLISKVALELLSDDELRALVAHETGHEYVWTEYERARADGDHKRLQDLELVCDIIAVMTLRAIGQDASPLVAAIEKVTRFNRARFGSAINEATYPSVARRRSVALALDARVRR